MQAEKLNEWSIQKINEKLKHRNLVTLPILIKVVAVKMY